MRDRNEVLFYRQPDCVGGCPIGSHGAKPAEVGSQARAGAAASFSRRGGDPRALAAMHEPSELAVDPGDLATATLAALPGGLLLTQIERSTRPPEKAQGAMLLYVEWQITRT